MQSEIFKNIRAFKGMTMKEFADWLGVSLATVSMIEGGHRPVSDYVRYKIAHKFDVSDSKFIEFCDRQMKASEYFLNNC